MDGFQSDGLGGLWASQPAAAEQSYTLDYSGDLAAGDTISSSNWTVETGLTMPGTGMTTTSATVKIAGGAGGKWYLVSNLVATANGEDLSKSFRIFISDAATFGSGIVSCFPSLAGAVASLRRDRLVLVAQNYLQNVTLDDAFLLEKLVAAEAEISRQLRVYLTPREILPWGATADEVTALKTAGNVVEIEPGYDYSPDLFQGNTWGLIELRQRPILAVHSITFNYPAPTDTLFTIPPIWIRPDPKVGRVNLVPVQDALSLPLNAFILSALGGGRTVPLMLQVRYRAGLDCVARDWPDILNVIKKESVLSIVEDALVPASASVSGDGLSQSVSFQADAYRKSIDATIKRLRIALNGVMMMVM